MADFKVTDHQGFPTSGSTGDLSHSDWPWTLRGRQEERYESGETETQTNNEAQCKVINGVLELSKQNIYNRVRVICIIYNSK